LKVREFHTATNHSIPDTISTLNLHVKETTKFDALLSYYS